MNDSQYPEYKSIKHTGDLEAPYYHPTRKNIFVELTHVFCVDWKTDLTLASNW